MKHNPDEWDEEEGEGTRGPKPERLNIEEAPAEAARRIMRALEIHRARAEARALGVCLTRAAPEGVRAGRVGRVIIPPGLGQGSLLNGTGTV